MEKPNWLTLANPVLRRAAQLLVGLVGGLMLEQVAALNVLPPEVVLGLRHALSGLW